MEAESEFVKPEIIEKRETKLPFTGNPTKRAKSVDYPRNKSRFRNNAKKKDRSHSHFATKVNRTRSRTPVGIYGQEGKQLDTLRASFSDTHCKLCNLLGHLTRNCQTYPGRFPSILQIVKVFMTQFLAFLILLNTTTSLRDDPLETFIVLMRMISGTIKKGFLKDKHRFGCINPEQEKREIRKGRVGNWREYSVGGRLEGNSYNPYTPSHTVKSSSYLSNINRNLPPSKTTPSGVTRKLDLVIGPQLSREGVCNLKNSKNHIEPSHTSFSLHSAHTHTHTIIAILIKVLWSIRKLMCCLMKTNILSHKTQNKYKKVELRAKMS
jgi:hypothetical protein